MISARYSSSRPLFCATTTPTCLPARLFTAPMCIGFAQLICTCWDHLSFTCVLMECVWALPPPQMCFREGTWHLPQMGNPTSDWGSSRWGTAPCLRLGLLRWGGGPKSYSSFISLLIPGPSLLEAIQAPSEPGPTSSYPLEGWLPLGSKRRSPFLVPALAPAIRTVTSLNHWVRAGEKPL